jgi:hypothetical protein
MPSGGARPGSGRKTGGRLDKDNPIPRISVPEAARRKTHKAIRILDQVMSRGILSRKHIGPDGKSRTVWEPASVALRVHCAELLLERGYGRPHQAIAVADGSSEGGRTLRDLILGAMALRDEPTVLEHEPAEAEDDEDDDGSAT